MTLGNHDAVLVRGPGSIPAEGIDQEEHAHQQWLCRVVPPRLRRRVARWPYALRRTIGGVRMLFVHYGLTPSGDDFGPFVPEPRPSDLDALFAGCDADVVFYGHHHGASDLVGSARYVNPGSAGCHTVPLARFVVVGAEQGAYTVEHHAVPYDDSPLWPAFRERAVPAAAFIHRAFFGGRWADDAAWSPQDG